jgi:hypothetical protein
MKKQLYLEEDLITKLKLLCEIGSINKNEIIEIIKDKNKMKNVLFIGLSDKVERTPLQTGTKSGDLIDKVIEKVNSICYKVNLVNFAPLDDNNNFRYPNKQEMDLGYINLEKVINELEPCICVCLGKKVSKYLSNKLNESINIIHPSHIAVYKREEMDTYVKKSAEIINLRLKGI